jgi:3-hydroxyacyl-[acyl-carrier-protein] dehydratase
MAARILTPAEVLAAIPQQHPFRFIDEIHELDAEHIVASYRFRADADFYRGHFPGRPITPGVLLIETMAQAGVVCLGIYLAAEKDGPESLHRMATLFTDANVEFAGVVEAGERVIVSGRKIYFRHRKLSTQVEMRRENEALVCAGRLSGMGVTLA